MKSIENKILNRIYSKGRGWCFTPKNFYDLGSPESIHIALHRLMKKGTIRRLARGLYDYPEKHSNIGLLSPKPEAIAQALSIRDNIRIQPSGAYAANILGLTEQVPAKIIFLTDGPKRRVKIGKQEIILKNTTHRYMAISGNMSAKIIHALKHIGQNYIKKNHIEYLKKKLSDEDKLQLLKDKIYAPGWMHSIINLICRQKQ
jgi:hypothetical protein